MTSVGDAARWTAFACELDPVPWDAASIGLLALAGDAVVEPELTRFLGPRAVVHTTRVSMSSTLDLHQLEHAVQVAVRNLLPGGRLGVVALACTSAAFTLGSDRVRELIQSVRPGTEVTDPFAASVAEFDRQGIQRISVVSPYRAELNGRLVSALAARGIQVVTGRSLRSGEVDRVLGRLPPNLVAQSSVLSAAIDADRDDVDAVFITCTGLRTAEILTQASAFLGKPVISSNAALAGQALRLATDRPGG